MQTLSRVHGTFIANKESILIQWVTYEKPFSILKLHGIKQEYFLCKYASGLFDYFMGIISRNVAIGNCPVMQELLSYFKKCELSSDELFEICSHFRRAMIDFSYDADLYSKELCDEISYIFDKNFKGLLKFYSDTMFQKLIDERQDALRDAQAKEYFLANMSHEIRTSLNAILGFVNLLIDEDVTSKQRNYLNVIHSSGEHLLSIINDILDFSKLRTKEFTINEKYFNIHDELSETIELFVASAGIKSITLNAFIDPTIPSELYGDALRVKQIVANFLSNAVKFTPEHGFIQVEAFYREGNLEISVKDSGRGISSLDKELIFKAFTQVEDQDTSHKSGTGLGLSISHQLAQKMSGNIRLISDLGEGSTFTLTLPLMASKKINSFFNSIEEIKQLKLILYAKEKCLDYKHDTFLRYANLFEMDVTLVDNLEYPFDICIFVYEESTYEMREAINRGDKKFIALMCKEYDTYDEVANVSSVVFPLFYSKLYIGFHTLFCKNKSSIQNNKQSILKKYKGHILVAEDNEVNQALIKIVLARYGLSFDIVENGEEACKLYEKNSYDLILMDEEMPILSGRECAKKIIEYEQQIGKGHTPISALTANVVQEVKERALANVFDTFLGKPLVLKDFEHLFSLYLKEDKSKEMTQEIQRSEKRETIVGLDIQKLTKELMLNEEELLMLLKLFLKKMQKIIPKLEVAICEQNLKTISLLSHSIKGSSGNFRIKILQTLSNDMEKFAKQGSMNFDYEASLNKIKKALKTIAIV